MYKVIPLQFSEFQFGQTSNLPQHKSHNPGVGKPQLLTSKPFPLPVPAKSPHKNKKRFTSFYNPQLKKKKTKADLQLFNSFKKHQK